MRNRNWLAFRSSQAQIGSGVAATPRPWWLLLLPLSYLLHLAEEWWGGEGFAAWTARAVDSPVSTTRFIILNSIVWPLFLLLTIAAILRILKGHSNPR